MQFQDNEIKSRAEEDVRNVSNFSELEKIKKKYLGRKGELAAVLKQMKDLPVAGRKTLGKKANALRADLEQIFDNKAGEFGGSGTDSQFDPTEPGRSYYVGHEHLVTQTRKEIEQFFASMGFSILEGPEIETEYYNFTALNIPEDHPARDMWDTYWLKNKKTDEKDEKLLLRTHTSTMQMRVMEKHKPPLAVIVPGRTFRHEATDARHEHTIDQIEGFWVDEDVNAGHLKYVLHGLFRSLFGPKVEIELRPSYFPFTEPSFELFMSCTFCNKKGCKVCGSGWLEMLGSGMIHPKVFEYAGYPKGKYQGFAFGLGIGRVAMLKYSIPDIRMLYQNDLRVLRQF